MKSLLTEEDARFLTTRRTLIRTAPAVFLGMVGALVMFALVSAWRTPMLANPGQVMHWVSAGKLADHTAQSLAVLTPILFQSMLALTAIVILLMLAHILKVERRYLEIIDRLNARGEEEPT